MRGNSKRKSILRAAMRKGSGGAKSKASRWLIAVTVAIVTLGLLSAGSVYTYIKLKELYESQCVATDLARQVKITTGSNVREGTVLALFGIRKNVNLAHIDFDTKRQEVLGKVPNIRDITVTRLLPDRVEITVSERDPIVRISARGDKTQRVVDTEGVVFNREVNSPMPVIMTRKGEVPKAGDRLTGRTLAALKLIEFCRSDVGAGLTLLEVDTTSADYLVATLNNYHRVKIRWDGMDEPTASTDDRMRKQVICLRDAIGARILTTGPGTPPLVWNATIPDSITVDTKEIIQ